MLGVFLSNLLRTKLLLLTNSLGILAMGVVGFVFLFGQSAFSDAKSWGIAGATTTVGIGLIVLIGLIFIFPRGRTIQNPQASIAIVGVCTAPWAYLVLALAQMFASTNNHSSSSIHDGAVVLTCAACLIFLSCGLLISSAVRWRKISAVQVTASLES